MIRIIILGLVLSSSIWACKMTNAALHQKTATHAVALVNPVNETLQRVSVDGLSSTLIFFRELVGSHLCVEKEVSFNLDASCNFTVAEKKETFIKTQDCR